MHERLSKTVEAAIRAANDIARSYDKDYVGTEHLLLGVARQQGSPGATLLARRKITPARLRKEIDRLAAKNLEETWVFGRLPGTPHFKNVMAKAIEEARAMGSNRICTQHLLLGLLDEKGSVAERALASLKVAAADIRKEAAKLQEVEE
jgi:ATP-dependent Clp protease ATP-binding subunit ClpC